MGDFELNLFLNFGSHLVARIVRRFRSYIKQTPNLPTPKLRTPISELPSSNFDLSGLASLRETSVIQRREQIFTRRRKGAKRSEVRRQRTKDRSQTSDVRNGESVRWRIRGQRPQNFKNAKRQTLEKLQTPNSELRASRRCASVTVWPNGSVSITPKRSDFAACEPLLFRAPALRRGRAHHQQSPRALGARPARASPRPDSIPARSSELTWPPVQ